LSTEDGKIPTQSGGPNDFPKLLRHWRPAHYNLCVAAEPRPDPWVKSEVDAQPLKGHLISSTLWHC
jgi:hypothetical protein